MLILVANSKIKYIHLCYCGQKIACTVTYFIYKPSDSDCKEPNNNYAFKAVLDAVHYSKMSNESE